MLLHERGLGLLQTGPRLVLLAHVPLVGDAPPPLRDAFQDGPIRVADDQGDSTALKA